MKTHYFIVTTTLFLISIGSGCKSFKHIPSSEDFYSTWDRDFRDGNMMPDTSEYWVYRDFPTSTLWHQLYYTKHLTKIQDEIDQSHWTRIEIINGTKLIAILYQNDKKIDRLEIQGRSVNNYFVCDQYKRKSCKGYRGNEWEDQIILNLDSKGNLQVTNCDLNSGYFLLIAGNGGGTFETTYLAKK